MLCCLSGTTSCGLWRRVFFTFIFMTRQKQLLHVEMDYFVSSQKFIVFARDNYIYGVILIN